MIIITKAMKTVHFDCSATQKVGFTIREDLVVSSTNFLYQFLFQTAKLEHRDVIKEISTYFFALKCTFQQSFKSRLISS